MKKKRKKEKNLEGITRLANFTGRSISSAYDLYKNDISLLTDESSLFDELEDQILLYETKSKNIKITYKEDLKLAEYLLKAIED